MAMRPRSILPFLAMILLAACGATGGASPRGSAHPASTVASGSRAIATPTPVAPVATPTPVDPGATPGAVVLAYRGDAARSGNMPGPGPDGTPAIRWTFQAGAPIGSQVVVVGKVVYVVSTDGTVHAVDLDTGRQQWSASIGAETHGALEVVDGLVIVGGENGAHAFAVSDGRPAWTAAKAGTVRGAPAIVGHTAVFDSDEGMATALDTRTGAVLWSQPLGAPDDTSVAALDGLAIFGLQDGTVVALAVADGTERWRAESGDGARIGTPAIADGRVYVASLDDNGPGTHHIMALDLKTGTLLWRFASPGDRPAYTPAIADGRAITEGEDGNVTALDAATGAVLWQTKAPGLVEVVPAIADGVVYGASNGGFAFAFDAATGTERWRLPIKGVPYGVAVTTGLVLVGTSVGTLDAIGTSVP
jgi:outer membrane protein assembly factor BamB